MITKVLGQGAKGGRSGLTPLTRVPLRASTALHRAPRPLRRSADSLHSLDRRKGVGGSRRRRALVVDHQSVRRAAPQQGGATPGLAREANDSAVSRPLVLTRTCLYLINDEGA